MKAAIVGVTGYTGIELIRLIQQHPQLEVGTLHSHSMHENSSVLYPHLIGLTERLIEPFDAEKIQKENQLVFFATPAGISKELAATFVANDFPVIDLSGDLRLKDRDSYQKWYHQEAAPAELLAHATYSLPEFATTPGNLIANPGCYATAAILAAAPLVQQKLFSGTLIFDGKSGLSGAGKKLTDSSHFATAADNMTMYKPNQHQHIPEIMQQFQQWDQAMPPIQFSTSLLPVKRGIFMTLYAPLKDAISQEDIYEQYVKTYQDHPFVRVQPLGKLPELRQVTGTNFCDIGLCFNPLTQVLTVVAVIDNLGKGAAGQAIQNFNRWAGIPETTGLMQAPLYP